MTAAAGEAVRRELCGGAERDGGGDVLGAGVGGLSTAAALRDLLPEPDRIILVDEHFESAQGLSLLWLLRGWRTPEQIRVTPTEKALPGVEMLKATVEAIDTATRTVLTSTGPLSYDALVVALGAALDTGAVSGLDQAIAAGVAAQYHTPEAAVRAHDLLRRIESGKIAFLVTSMPYKCPAAPYEGAMLAADLLDETGVRDAVTIDVHTPGPHPMPVAGPVVGAGVVDMLHSLQIGFRPGRQVERVDSDARQIVFTDGERTGFDLLIAIPPHRPPTAVAAAGFSEAGWIPVDPHTLASSIDGVWALGDVAAITMPVGMPLPKAAVFAKGQALAVAAGITRHLGYPAAERSFDGHGHCFLETGDHLSARGAGNFYHLDGPKIALSEPSPELHQAKEEEEADWLARWNQPSADS